MFNRKLSVAVIALLGLSLTLMAAENLLKPTNKADSWRLEQHEGGKAKIEVDGDAILFTVTDADGTDWHVQGIQTGLKLKNDAKYELSFSAKVDADREITVAAGIDVDDWHGIGLSEAVGLTKEWKKQTLEFTASDVHATTNRISFILGGAKGKVWLKDVSLTAK